MITFNVMLRGCAPLIYANAPPVTCTTVQNTKESKVTFLHKIACPANCVFHFCVSVIFSAAAKLKQYTLQKLGRLQQGREKNKQKEMKEK